MILLEHVTKRYPTREGWRTVLDDVSIAIPTDRNVGILGRNGSGKSTLVRLIAAAEAPDRGRVRRNVRVSWPLGFGGGLVGSLTARDNIRFVARIYGADPQSVLREVEAFAELGEYLDMPVGTYSAGMRARLSLGLSLAIDFECYLVDELPGVADVRFRARYQEALARRRERSTMILVSHSITTIARQCQSAAVLHEGRVTWFDRVDQAIAVYRTL